MEAVYYWDRGDCVMIPRLPSGGGLVDESHSEGSVSKSLGDVLKLNFLYSIRKKLRPKSK